MFAKNILFPICRSITGNGIKKTLLLVKKRINGFKIHRIRSRTRVFDWKVPPEWNIKSAYIKDKYNKKIVDFNNNNLHVVGYSQPIKKKLNKKEILDKIHTMPKLPDAIPYVTSYYKKYWGFCTSAIEKKKIIKRYNKSDIFDVCIDSNFNKNGNLNFGEIVLKGKSKEEILISTYICHPSMANNELSGPIVSLSLIDYYKKVKLSKTIRFVFVPETIGSIAYLYQNLEYLKKNVIGGYNLSCIGDERSHSCIFSKYNNSPSDDALREAYKKLKIKYKVFSFLDRGSDERQYNSPGIDLGITSIFRTKYGEYPEYHTSNDNFSIVTLKGIKGGFKVTKTAIDILLNNHYPKTKIFCEPHMSKRNLYPTLSNNNVNKKIQKIMDFIQYCDGSNSIKKISQIIKLSFYNTKKIAHLLKNKNIII